MEESPQEPVTSDANGHSDDTFDEQTLQIIQSCKELPATTDITNWEMGPVDLMETNKKFNQLSNNKKISKITKKECMKCFIQAHGTHVPLTDVESICDLDKDNHLNFGEFAIATFLLHQRLKGRKVPKSLPSDWTSDSSGSDTNHSEHDNNTHTTLHVNNNNDSPQKSLERGNSAISLNGTRANSGLPPKSKSELQKHMKEAEEIQKKIQKQLVIEEKEREKREAIKAAREKRIQEANIFWKDVIVTWPTKRNLPKTKALWWHGFPSSVRGHMWVLAIANELNITEELFEIFGGHAKSAREKKGTTLGREDTVDLIPVDLPRTFPALSIFQENGPCHEQLRDVLEAYVCFRPDVGYEQVQGMSYMAAVFLLNLDTFSAFKCLTNILNRSMFLTFFRMNEVELARYFHAYETALSQTYSKLYKHLRQFEFNHMTYLVDWVMTMYSKALPIDISSRIWDVYFAEGEYFIFRTAIGLLKYLGPKLEKAPFDDIVKLLHHLPSNMDEDDLFACIEKVDLTAEKWQKLMDNAKKK